MRLRSVGGDEALHEAPFFLDGNVSKSPTNNRTGNEEVQCIPRLQAVLQVLPLSHQSPSTQQGDSNPRFSARRPLRNPDTGPNPCSDSRRQALGGVSHTVQRDWRPSCAENPL